MSRLSTFLRTKDGRDLFKLVEDILGLIGTVLAILFIVSYLPTPIQSISERNFH